MKSHDDEVLFNKRMAGGLPENTLSFRRNRVPPVLRMAAAELAQRCRQHLEAMEGVLDQAEVRCGVSGPRTDTQSELG
jgi:hypothetical protein